MLCTRICIHMCVYSCLCVCSYACSCVMRFIGQTGISFIDFFCRSQRRCSIKRVLPKSTGPVIKLNCGSFINTLDKISSSFSLLYISKSSSTSQEEYFMGRKKVLSIGRAMILNILRLLKHGKYSYSLFSKCRLYQNNTYI